MSLKDILQGKWFGHPLHPALVHVPTGLFPAALIFDLVSRSGGGSNVAVRISFAAIAVGVVAALAAAPTGLADWWEIKPQKPAHKLGLWHMVLNIAVLLVMIASFVIRWRDGLDARMVSIPALSLCAVANIVLAASGYLGGRMVYDHGVSVARMSKKYWRRIALEGKAKLPPEEG